MFSPRPRRVTRNRIKNRIEGCRMETSLWLDLPIGDHLNILQYLSSSMYSMYFLENSLERSSMGWFHSVNAVYWSAVNLFSNLAVACFNTAKNCTDELWNSNKTKSKNCSLLVLGSSIPISSVWPIPIWLSFKITLFHFPFFFHESYRGVSSRHGNTGVTLVDLQRYDVRD